MRAKKKAMHHINMSKLIYKAFWWVLFYYLILNPLKRIIVSEISLKVIFILYSHGVYYKINLCLITKQNYPLCGLCSQLIWVPNNVPCLVPNWWKSAKFTHFIYSNCFDQDCSSTY